MICSWLWFEQFSLWSSGEKLDIVAASSWWHGERIGDVAVDWVETCEEWDSIFLSFFFIISCFSSRTWSPVSTTLHWILQMAPTEAEKMTRMMAKASKEKSNSFMVRERPGKSGEDSGWGYSTRSGWGKPKLEQIWTKLLWDQYQYSLQCDMLLRRHYFRWKYLDVFFFAVSLLNFHLGTGWKQSGDVSNALDTSWLRILHLVWWENQDWNNCRQLLGMISNPFFKCEGGGVISDSKDFIADFW